MNNDSGNGTNEVNASSDYFPLRQLTDKFYEENTHLQRILDKEKGQDLFVNKGRGYGVVVLEIYGVKFGIPLRSNMTHKYCFATKTWRDEVEGRTYRKGLDYTKAVILNDDDYIKERTFKIPAKEFDKINDEQERIHSQFEKFVKNYIKAVKRNDQNLLSKNYRDSTLINYHEQLGLVEIQVTE